MKIVAQKGPKWQLQEITTRERVQIHAQSSKARGRTVEIEEQTNGAGAHVCDDCTECLVFVCLCSRLAPLLFHLASHLFHSSAKHRWGGRPQRAFIPRAQTFTNLAAQQERGGAVECARCQSQLRRGHWCVRPCITSPYSFRASIKLTLIVFTHFPHLSFYTTPLHHLQNPPHRFT